MSWFESFTDWAASNLDERVLESLANRGVSDEQIAEFRLGYIRAGFDCECSAGFTKWAASKLEEDVYVFPLTNILGEVRGFQFRPVERGKSGYMDYMEDLGEPVLFGLGQASKHIWTARRALFVEGPFDHFPIQRHDPTTLATITARVPPNLIPFLRATCDQVVFGYDNDATGRRGVERFVKEYRDEFKVHDMCYPKLPTPSGKPTKDPGDMWEMWGDKRLGDFVRKHSPKEEFNYG